MTRLLDDAKQQSRRVAVPILRTAALTGLGLVGIGLLVRVWGVGFADLSRDPLSVAGREFYLGGLSNLFVLAWWSAATVCILAAAVLARAGFRSRARFMFIAGLLTAWLTLDDFFQFHEDVVPVYLGLRETVVHVVYIAAAIAFVVLWRDLILRTEYLILGAAAAFFAMSSLVDEIIVKFVGKIPLEHLLEDGAKFVGIALWLLYFWRTSLEWMRPAMVPPEPERSRDAGTIPAAQDFGRDDDSVPVVISGRQAARSGLHPEPARPSR